MVRLLVAFFWLFISLQCFGTDQPITLKNVRPIALIKINEAKLPNLPEEDFISIRNIFVSVLVNGQVEAVNLGEPKSAFSANTTANLYKLKYLELEDEDANSIASILKKFKFVALELNDTPTEVIYDCQYALMRKSGKTVLEICGQSVTVK